jgi:hypothetical protein
MMGRPEVDRIDRFVQETLRPLIVAASAPVDIAAWHVPGEPRGARCGYESLERCRQVGA